MERTRYWDENCLGMLRQVEVALAGILDIVHD
jgi:hypothetical protein